MSGATHHSVHAPARGWTARLLGRFHVTGIFWYRAHHWGAKSLPQWSIAPIIRVCTACFFVALRRIRAAIAVNLEPVLGPAGWLERQRRMHRTLLEFAWCLTERYERLALNRPVDVEFSQRWIWEEQIASGAGFVFVTAHIGNWEVASGLSSDQTRRVHVVREEELDPEAQRFIGKLIAQRMGDRYVTHFAGSDPQLALRLADALGKGDLVALQGDRPRAGGRTIATEMFGQPYDLPAGPLALARAAGVSILPVFMLRQGRRRYRLAFRPPIRVADTDDRVRDLGEAAARLAEQIEWAIREAPHQWFCFNRVWPDHGRR